MAPEAALQEMTTTDEHDAGRTEMIPIPLRHIHRQAYACWDSEETRHFYEDILEMPLIATVVIEDPFRTDGSGFCYTFFEIGDGDTLAFFEHMSLVHPQVLQRTKRLLSPRRVRSGRRRDGAAVQAQAGCGWRREHAQESRNVSVPTL